MGMLFDGKYKRFRQLQKEKREAMPYGKDESIPADEMERGDLAAMLIAALMTFLPVGLLVLAVLSAIGFFFIV